MRNITKSGYEAITVIRSMYDPVLGNHLDISPALWINECSKRKYFVFAPQGCITEIYELSEAINDFVDGIITPCGTILPMDNKIEFLDSEGIGLECVDGKIKFVIKAPLDTTLGGTGFIEFNEGDILVGNAEGKLSILIKGDIGQAIGIKPDGTVGYIDVVKKLTCDGSDNVTENAFVRWSVDGKCLKDSKTIQQDNGTTQTTSDATSYLLHQIENTKSDNFHDAAYEAAVQSPGGNPIYRLIRRLKQTWTIFSEAADESFRISGVNQEDPDENGDIIKLYRNGIFTAPNQPKASAILKSRTPNFPINQYFKVGSNLAFTKIRDEDGFNKSANNLFPGDGAGNPVYYDCKYDGVMGISFQLLVDQSVRDTETLVRYRVNWGSFSDPQQLKFEESFGNAFYKSMSQTVFLPVVKGDKIFIDILVTKNNPYLNSFAVNREIDNYIGFFYTGF